MKLTIINKFALVFVAGIIITSCNKEKVFYPSQPAITYKDFLRYGNSSHPDSVALVVSFTDNEGDVSIEQKDKQGLLKDGNFFMYLYFWDTTGVGHWEADNPYTPQIDTIKFTYSVPPLLPKHNENEPMQGVIYAKQYPFINPFKKIKFVVYMYDRALHKSNIIETPALQF